MVRRLNTRHNTTNRETVVLREAAGDTWTNGQVADNIEGVGTASASSSRGPVITPGATIFDSVEDHAGIDEIVRISPKGFRDRTSLFRASVKWLV